MIGAIIKALPNHADDSNVISYTRFSKQNYYHSCNRFGWYYIGQLENSTYRQQTVTIARTYYSRENGKEFSVSFYTDGMVFEN